MDHRRNNEHTAAICSVNVKFVTENDGMEHHAQFTCHSPLCRTLPLSFVWSGLTGQFGRRVANRVLAGRAVSQLLESRVQTSDKAELPMTHPCTGVSAAVSSLVEAGTVDDLRELSERVHRVHGFLCLGCSLFRLVRYIQSRVRGLIQCADPG